MIFFETAVQRFFLFGTARQAGVYPQSVREPLLNSNDPLLDAG